MSPDVPRQLAYRVRGRDVVAAVADVSGASMPELTEVARRLREEDLFVRETKSERSWRCQPWHAANLLAAVMSGAPALRAAEGVRDLAEYRLTSAAWDSIPSPTPVWLNWAREPVGWSFVDGLEQVLLDIAEKGPSYLDEIRSMQVDLHLTTREADFVFLPKGGRGVVLSFEHETSLDLSRLSLRRTVKLQQEALLHVGLVFHRGRQGAAS